MSSGKSTSPISQGEMGRVVLCVTSQGGHMIKPVHNIAKLLNEHFGWPLGSGTIRAKAIINLLLKAKVIAVIRDGKGLKSINLVLAKKLDDNLSPQLIKPKVAPPPVIEDRSVIKRRNFKTTKKGEAKRNRSAMFVGDRAEHRLHRLSVSLGAVVLKKLPDTVLGFSASRSGHHNPDKGKIDLRDSGGDDITITLTINKNGSLKKGKIIYDAKSSRSLAEKFNSNVWLCF